MAALLPIRTMVVAKNRTTNPPKMSAMTMARFLRRAMSEGLKGALLTAAPT
jgi:hypothetical protein